MLRRPRSSKLARAVPIIAAALVVPGVARAQAGDEPAEERGAGAVPGGSSGAVARPAPPGAPPSPAAVVPPKLEHFEEAPYPPEALAAGLTADVVLALTIDATGAVTQAEVLEPAGHGFDEAARAAALGFRFSPATRGGAPIPVKIKYRYSFTLEEAPPAPAPPPPKTGNLGGRIDIAGTDTPLAGATVVVTTPSGAVERLVTDAQGRWELTLLPPGKYSLEVRAVGFVTVEQTEEVVAGEAAHVTYRLAPESEGIEVTVQGERPPREVTRRTLERREISRIPGTGGDALRSILSLPGVARPPAIAGLLIVRGSSPQDSAIFIDGTWVPLVYHFGGLSSVVPTELLDRIDFYPGNFSARYGRVTGGIVDAGLRAPDTRCTGPYGKPSDKDGCYHGMAQVDLIDARLMLQGPLGPVKGWTFAAAGRRSWMDAWLKPALEQAGAGVTTAPVYYDYQVIAETRPTRDSRVSLRAFGSDDRLDMLITDPASEDPGFGGNLTFGTAFWRIQGLYSGKLARDAELSSMLSVGKDALDFSVGTFNFALVAHPIELRNELGWRVAEGFKLNLGMDYYAAPYDAGVRAPQPPRPGEPDPGPFSTRPPIDAHFKGTVFRPAWYAEAELTPTRRLRVVPGARLDYARDTGHLDFSPRLNARYDVVSPHDEGAGDDSAPRHLRTTVKGGVGLFAQPPQYQQTTNAFGTPGLYSNRAIHYSVGVEQELSRHVEADVEGFFKDLSSLVSSVPEGTGYRYGNDGSGYVVGLETLIKYKPDKRFFGWIAYTLSRSIRQTAPDEPEFLYHYDQTHNLTALGSYRLGRGWEFGARFRIVSGSLVTPVLAGMPALYAADAGAYTPLQGAVDSERLPLFHQLDIRVDKRWQFEDWRLSAYLDVQNVYNNAAIEGISYNYNYSQHTYQSGLPILPSVGVRGEF
ncbi:MAG: TonB-dependent receptor [Sorangiineae bacterium]|nr:TonB-dependent receptor [Polyangiaceae bacterium]MEB2321059.1 TonB-dependent receptor [Sorangiineae bacterium]